MAKSGLTNSSIFSAARGLLPLEENISIIKQSPNVNIREDGKTALNIALENFVTCASEQPANPLKIRNAQNIIVELAKKGGYIHEPTQHIISDITSYLRQENLHIFHNKYSADLENMLIKEFLPKLPEPDPKDLEYYLNLLNDKITDYEKSALLKSFLTQLISENKLAQATTLANMKNQRGQTTLHIAAHGDDVDFTEFLLNEIGITNPNALDNSGHTAFDNTHSVRIKHLLTQRFGVSSKELQAQKQQNPIYAKPRQNSIKSSDSGIGTNNNISRSQSLDSGLANEKNNEQSVYEIGKEILRLENELSQIRKGVFSTLTSRNKIETLRNDIANLYNKLGQLDQNELNKPFNDNGQYRTILDLARLPSNQKNNLKNFLNKLENITLLTGQEVRSSELAQDFNNAQKLEQQKSEFNNLYKKFNHDLATATLPNLADSAKRIEDIKSSLTEMLNQADQLGIALESFEISSSLQKAFQHIEDIKENEFYHKLGANSAFTRLLEGNYDYASIMRAAKQNLGATTSKYDYPILSPEQIEEISLISRRFAQNFCDIEYNKFIKAFELNPIAAQSAFNEASQPVADFHNQLAQAEEILYSFAKPEEKLQQVKEIFNASAPEARSQFMELQDRNGNKIANYADNFDPDFFDELVERDLVDNKFSYPFSEPKTSVQSASIVNLQEHSIGGHYK